jgi:hypothetical protein
MEIVVAAFEDPSIVPQVHVTYDLQTGEAAAGAALAREIVATGAAGAVVLLFFDSVAATSPLRLHPASALVEGFQAGLGGTPMTLIGGGLLTDMNLSDSWVFDGEAVCKHAAVALVFPPGIRASTVVLHGCWPVSTFLTITSVEGAVVHELDGEPALDVVERMLGMRLEGDGAPDLSLVATLGQKQGDPFAPYDENAYVNRLILSADRSAGSITLFEPDFAAGTRVQIMSRDNARMLESVHAGTAAIAASGAAASRAGRERFLALCIDCAGRASARSGAAVEDAELVLRNLGADIPVLGFYSGVEIAPFGRYSRPLDWTAVLTVLERERL